MLFGFILPNMETEIRALCAGHLFGEVISGLKSKETEKNKTKKKNQSQSKQASVPPGTH